MHSNSIKQLPYLKDTTTLNNVKKPKTAQTLLNKYHYDADQ